MRIGLVIYGSLDTPTGGYLYDRMVVEGLVRLGHEVEVIDLPSGSYLRRLCSAFSAQLLRRLLAGRFDILLEDELCHPSLFYVNKRLHHQNGPPLVAIVHHILSDEQRYRLQNIMLAVIERGFLASVDAFIHNSETTRRKVAALLDHKRPQVVANPAGDRFAAPLAPEVIQNRCQRPGPLELLFLGSVIPRKGLLPLLQALAGVDREAWRLSIAGGLDFDPAHVARAQRLVGQLGLADSVRFLGHLEDDHLVETLSASHLFCMPYAYEGFGIAILEAMAFGLPAIGCRNGAAGETISHGTNGFLLAPGDITGLKPLLMQLHHDRQELRRLALAARATFADRPKWQDSTAVIDSFLQRIQASPDSLRGAGAVGKPGSRDLGDADATG